MAPLDTIDMTGYNIKDESKLNGWLDKLKSVGVDGIMIDVWWGITEKYSKSYIWDGYAKVFDLIKSKGLRIHPVFSFHQCGGNVGDDVNIPLPSFIVNSAEQPFYIDGDGIVDKEYISLGYDEVIVNGRTPIQMYKDWMSAFMIKFGPLIHSETIDEIEIGLGPAGELRYPGYQSNKGWSFPGCGEFQSYDQKMKEQLRIAASKAGKPSHYGEMPTNVGGYNTRPYGSEFWNSGDKGYIGDRGQFFIKWYSAALASHADRVYKAARSIFPNQRLSGKISGIHWWYNNPCHCAEVTSGYNNFIFYDGYKDLMNVFGKYKVDLDFTCLEMTQGQYDSDPPALVSQVSNDAIQVGIHFCGENALPIFDESNYQRILSWKSRGLHTFTYLRLCDTLMQDWQFNIFKKFVQNMH